ncbi:MAG: hypothetical protein LBI15_03030 [Dysgonamonadaceae bacterium]|jgi:hypothetical protein|nr:hypothetical protein [Dysgonamonadaceae bacterium]
MNGKLGTAFINLTIQCLEKRCLNLLIDGYNYVKSNSEISIDWEEENISAVLFDYIEKCPLAFKWQIDIIPEFRLYAKDILENKKSAKTSSRIDFRFCCWTNTYKFTYFAEAKNLIEVDSFKKGRKTKISATSLHKRYIETGIDNYFSEKYPSNGCLLGYVLQGKTENIIDSINGLLSNNGRQSEQLDFDCSKGCYISKNDKLSIKHLMFDFTQSST